MAIKLRERFRRLFRKSHAGNKIQKKSLERRGTITSPREISEWLSQQAAPAEVHELATAQSPKQTQPEQRIPSSSEERLRPASAPANVVEPDTYIPRPLSPAQSVQLPSGAWAADVLTTLRLDSEHGPVVDSELTTSDATAIADRNEDPETAASASLGQKSAEHPADQGHSADTTRESIDASSSHVNESATGSRHIPTGPSQIGTSDQTQRSRPASIYYLLPGSWPGD